jgi:hypothetical protein
MTTLSLGFATDIKRAVKPSSGYWDIIGSPEPVKPDETVIVLHQSDFRMYCRGEVHSEARSRGGQRLRLGRSTNYRSGVVVCFTGEGDAPPLLENSPPPPPMIPFNNTSDILRVSPRPRLLGNSCKTTVSP